LKNNVNKKFNNSFCFGRIVLIAIISILVFTAGNVVVIKYVNNNNIKEISVPISNLEESEKTNEEEFDQWNINIKTRSGVTPLTDDVPHTDSLNTDEEDKYSFPIRSYDYAAVAVRPPSGSDFDLRVYSDSGFSSLVKYSQRGGSKIDVVILDGHAIGATTYYAKAYQYSGSGSYQIEAEYSIPDKSVPSTSTYSFSTSEVMDVFEVPFTSAKEYRIELTTIASGLNPNLYLFDTTDHIHPPNIKSENSGSSDESIEYIATATKDYCIIVTNENSGSGSYRLEINEVPSTQLLYDDSPRLGTITVADPTDYYSFYIRNYDYAAVGIRPPGSADFDLKVYSDDLFTNLVDSSTYGTGQVDFVVCNGHSIGSTTYYAKVYRFSGTGNYQVEAEYSIPDDSPGNSYSRQISGNEVVDSSEISLTASTQYTIDLVTPSGVDMDLYLFDSTGGKNDAIKKSEKVGGGVDEQIIYTPSTTGKYCIVVTNENGGSGQYNLNINNPTPVMTPTSLTITNSPDKPNEGGYTFVTVEVKDNLNNLVTEGSLTLTASSGTLESANPALVNGKATTKWTAPRSTGTRTITATFSDDAGGAKYYKSCSNSKLIIVITDSDDSDVDVGIEWVNDYPGTDDDNNFADDNSRGCYNQLNDHGYTKNFDCGDDWAWEEDFKRTDGSWGGTNTNWIDDVDVCVFTGHSTTRNSEKRLWFGDDDHDDDNLDPNPEARDAWGDSDLEWICLTSCELFADSDDRDDYAETMDGLRLILGWETTASAGAASLPSGIWADKMTKDDPGDQAEPVAKAWALAVEEHDNTKTVGVIGENDNCFDDYLWGQGTTRTSDPTDDTTYTYRDTDDLTTRRGSRNKADETEAKTAINVIDLGNGITLNMDEIPDFGANSRSRSGSMPNYRVIRPQVTDDYVWGHGTNLGLSSQTEVGDSGTNHLLMVDGDLVLRVPLATGSLVYYDNSQYYEILETQPNLPTTEDAINYADAFLMSNGYWRTGIQYERILLDTTYHINEETSEILDYIDNYYIVIYNRMIGDTPVEGPGSFMKVYVGGDGDILAFFQTWREVEEQGMIEIISVDQALINFQERGPLATLNGIPPNDGIIINDIELGYHARNLYTKQYYLQPIYIFHSELEIDGDFIPYNIYIPADGNPPTAIIISPVEGSSYTTEDTVIFQCDITGGTAPYLCEWSSDVDGILGTHEYMEDTFEIHLSADYKAGALEEEKFHKITLTVIDSKGLMDVRRVAPIWVTEP
jgi:hypothetical protein